MSGLGAVTKVEFNVDCSSDNGFGNSQPSYFAYDNVAVRFERETVEITGVELSKTELALEVGGSEILTATVKPDNATDKTVTWESANETIVTVGGNGEVTAVGEGETIITATVGGKTAQCVVTVTAVPTGGEGITISTGHTAEYPGHAYLSNIHIRGVSGTASGENDSWNVLLSEKVASLTIELTASVTMTPNRFFWVNDNVTDLALSESLTGVVTVEPVWIDHQAVIKVGVGIAKQFNGTKYTITLGVTDQNRAPVLTSGNNSSADLKVNQTYTLDVTELFKDNDGDALTYTVNNEKIADPYNYTFTPDSAGPKTLIFKAYDGKDYSEPYTVTLNVTENSIPVASAEDDKFTVDQYKTKTIDLSKLFSDADEDELSYFVDTGDGNKQALSGSKYSYDTSKAGTYTLKFYAKDVMDFSAAYTVTLTVDPIDRYTIATGETGGMPNNVGVVTEIYIDYQKAVDHHYIKYNDGTRTIA
ncbi:MAG: Ig-like domain-containing protein, partial [Firmicutes bacterium]|nr:Ig-like domain-containing protein [Bacillota bacterium]